MLMNSDFRDQVLIGNKDAEAFLVGALTPVFFREVQKTALSCNATWILNDLELQKELVQQSFLSVFDRNRALLRRWDPSLDQSKGLLSYLSFIAKRTTLNHKVHCLAKKRGSGRQGVSRDSLEGFPEGGVDERCTPEKAAEDRQLVRILSERVTQRFSERGQLAFSMLFLVPRPIAEICQGMDATTGSVHTWKRRLKMYLKDVMADLDGEDDVEVLKCA